jgi:16S rRNA (guanine966-N2)-methyltransferase
MARGTHVNRGAGRTGSVRIIAGRWRGRRIPVPDVPGLRPTGDRVRETLFNWLAPELPGARCLDLFAGSGALGLEALSRDAAAACFVDRDRRATEALRVLLGTLGVVNARLVASDAEAFLRGTPEPWDVVFLDPPFAAADLGKLCTLLAAGWVRPGSRVYLETDRRNALPALPPGWELHRESTAGEVRFALARAT